MQENSFEKWWVPQEFAKKRQNLKIRSTVIQAVRHYFVSSGFEEVQTPVLQVCPTIDTHIHALKTVLKNVDLIEKKELYLQTSPEFDMKKLLTAGMDKIFQICPVFRNAEGSRLHSPEFMLLEWYRAGVDYTHIMQDCEGLLRACATAAGTGIWSHKEQICDITHPFERLSVEEAFDRYAGLNLVDCMEDKQFFYHKIRGMGFHVAEDDGWDDLFFRVMAAKIEPFLGFGRASILYDYPVSMAALSRKKADNPRFAERFELYVCGVELANAFSELVDPEEQLARYKLDMAEKQRLYGEYYPMDESFMEAMRYGMPNSAGIALGLDRLVMLAVGAEHIKDVQWTSYDFFA